MEMPKLAIDEHIVLQSDLAACAKLLNEVWPVPRWEYTPEMLSAYVDRPGQEMPTSLGFLCGQELAGLLFGFRYHVLLNGQRLVLSYGTWWTSAPRFVLRKVGLKLMSLGRLIALASGTDVAIAFTRADSNADTMNRSMFARFGLRYALLRTSSELMTTPQIVQGRVKSVDISATVRVVTESMTQDILALARAVQPSVDLFREYDEKEIPFLFVKRPGTRSWIYYDEQDRPRALLNVMIKGFRRDSVEQNAYIEHLLAPDLSKDETAFFFRQVMKDPVWQSIKALSFLDNGTFPVEQLRACGFFPSREKINSYLIPYKDEVQLELPAQGSFNLEVF